VAHLAATADVLNQGYRQREHKGVNLWHTKNSSLGDTVPVVALLPADEWLYGTAPWGSVRIAASAVNKSVKGYINSPWPVLLDNTFKK
jgi:hypothetical protein